MSMPGSEHEDGIERVDAVIVGAGFSGLYMLHRLRDVLGLSARVYEAGGGVGGTWHWNRYPGARSDTESFVYCFSFDEELWRQWQWKSRYALQPDILAYLEHVADRFDLRRDIRLDTRVVGARFDEEVGRWLVEDEHGDRVSTRFLITGVGLLASAPYAPTYPGLDSYAGRAFHCGQWPAEGVVDLRGKRVGVIGTGSTGVQVIPTVAREAEHLYVFQRTPQYAMPARNFPLDDAFQRDLQARFEEIWETSRWSAGGMPYEMSQLDAFEATPEERERRFEALWQEGGFKLVAASYRNVLTDRRANDFVAEFVRAKIRATVEDPDVAEALLPTDHPIGSRRPIIESGYYETFNRSNVTLVDVRHAPIQTFTPHGIRTEAADYELDVVIFATGFDAVTGPFMRMDLAGRRGVSLRDLWTEQHPGSYLGLAIHGFPNLFMITGPGAMFGNLPVSIEHHVEWISDCIGHMLDEGIEVIEADAQAQGEWMAGVDRMSRRSLISLAQSSWFTGTNIPGREPQALIYFGNFGVYRRSVDEVAEQGYRGFTALAVGQPT